MALSGDLLRIGEIPSPRWERALERIADAGPLTVLDCEPPVGLQRYDGWPGANGHIHLSIYTTLEPESLTQEIAARDVRAGLEYVEQALAAEPRLQVLFDDHGVVREYVFDYGKGAVQVGVVSEDGTVTLT